MTRDFLRATIPGITDDQINAIMGENGNDINAVRQSITAKDTEIGRLNAEITHLQEQAKGNDPDLPKKLSELQQKYDKDTAELQAKYDGLLSKHALERAFADVPFASSLARKAAMSEFAKDAKLKEDGTFEGVDDYIAKLKKEDPGSFKPDDKPDKGSGSHDNGGGDTSNTKPTSGGAPAPQTPPAAMPRFTGQMTNGGAASANGGSTNPLGFAFNYVRQPPQNGGQQ